MTIALAAIGIFVGLLGAVITAAIFIYERRRPPKSVPDQPLRAREKQRTISMWTIGRFYQSLRQFDLYCDRLENPNYAATTDDDTKPSRADLLRFAEAVLLTAAVDILPFSQGKANLFHFADDPVGDSRKIVSQVFIGAFPPSQILSGMRTFRELNIERDSPAPSVAGECVRTRQPELEEIDRKKNFSSEEIQLGTTHILGIPAHIDSAIGVDDFCRIPQSMPAAITVDLRLGLLPRLLKGAIRRFSYRRSKFVCDRLGRYSVLSLKQKLDGDD